MERTRDRTRLSTRMLTLAAIAAGLLGLPVAAAAQVIDPDFGIWTVEEWEEPDTSWIVEDWAEGQADAWTDDHDPETDWWEPTDWADRADDDTGAWGDPEWSPDGDDRDWAGEDWFDEDSAGEGWALEEWSDGPQYPSDRLIRDDGDPFFDEFPRLEREDEEPVPYGRLEGEPFVVEYGWHRAFEARGGETTLDYLTDDRFTDESTLFEAWCDE